MVPLPGRISAFILFSILSLQSAAQSTVMSENVGNPAGIIALASYSGWQNNGVYTYSAGGQANPADVRNTTPSGAYTGSSAAGNVNFSSSSGSYGFAIEGIDASAYTGLSVQFGYRKELAASHASFSVDYWNGTAWVTIANTAAALFNEPASAAVSWYLSKSIALPVGAQISGLKLRFVKSGTKSIRIDDIVLTGTLLLSAPQVLAATNISSSSFNAIWKSVPGAQQYRLDVSTSPVFNTTLSSYTDLAVTDTFTLVSGLSADQTYYYRVRSYASGNSSTNSGTAMVQTWKDPATAAYRSRSSGLLTDPASWDYNYTGSSYTAAIQAPGAANDVTILNGDTISMNTSSSVKGLVLNGGLNDNGYNLSVAGDLSGAGLHTSTANGSIRMTGNNTVSTIGGPASDTLKLDNLELDDADGFTLTGNIHLLGELRLSSGLLNTNSGILTLTSSDDKTASIGQITGGSIAGPVTVERYIPAKRAWRFLCSPVNSTGNIWSNWQEGGAAPSGYGTYIMGNSADVANGLDLNPSGQRSMFSFDAVSQSWLPVTNTISDNLIAGQGYRIFLRGDRTSPLSQIPTPPANETRLRATGSLLTGTVAFGGGSNSSSPATLPSLADTAGQFTLIGNPYASSADWESIVANSNTTGINPNYYWAWDAKINGSNGRGGYVVFETGTPPIAPSEVSRYIQPGQAIFVQTIASNPKLEFREADKAAGNTHVFKTTSGDSRVVVRLFLQDTLFADAASVKFDNAYSTAFGFEDAGKFINPDENVAISRDTDLLSVDARPELLPSDTIHLKIWQLEGTDYTLRIKSANLPAGTQGWLVDSYLGATTALDMAGETAVPFTLTAAPASAAADRFFLIFSNSPLLADAISLTATDDINKVVLTCKARYETKAKEYAFQRSDDGHSFTTFCSLPAKGNDGTDQFYSCTDASPFEGTSFYRVKLSRIDGTTIVSETRKIVRPSIGHSFSIYPNPVSSAEINIDMRDLSAGTYYVKLVDHLGTTVFKTEISHTDGLAHLRLPEHFSDGLYGISLTGEGCSLSNTILIQLNH